MKALVTTALGLLPLLWLTLSSFSAPPKVDPPTAPVAADRAAQDTCNPGCGAHGECRDGRCLCRDGYTGVHCQIPPPPPTCTPPCAAGGVCQNGRCICQPGYSGAQCQIPPP